MKRDNLITAAAVFGITFFSTMLLGLICLVLIPEIVEHNKPADTVEFMAVPPALMEQFTGAGGRVKIDSKYDGPTWSAGYYDPNDKTIHIRTDVNMPETVIFLHELAHYAYMTNSQVVKDEWAGLAMRDFEKSVWFVKYDDGPRDYYYADPTELFCQEFMLVLYKDYNTKYENMYKVEKQNAPALIHYVERIIETYYNGEYRR